MQIGTFLERIKHNVNRDRAVGSTSVDYEDLKALISAAEALRKHDPNHRALKWLDSGRVVIA